MATWTDDSGDVVASTTFTDSRGRHYIAGVEVHEFVWDEYQRYRRRLITAEDDYSRCWQRAVRMEAEAEQESRRRKEVESLSRTHLAQCRHAKEDLRGTVRELAELVRGALDLMDSQTCRPDGRRVRLPDTDPDAWWEAAESVLEGLDHHTWTFMSDRLLEQAQAPDGDVGSTG